MIETRQVMARARQLYSDLKRRSAPTYWKNGRLAGRMRWPGAPIPYTSDEFAAWIMRRVGCQAFLCPYCNAPLDVLSMVLDHDTPLHGGGTNDFENLVPCCADCNTIKGKVVGEQYHFFRQLMRKLHPSAETDILSRLRSGAMGQRLAQQLRAGKSAKQKPALVRSEEPF
jgi:5-methylcytosine-specific restriction endonuclease McrA